MTLIRFVDSLPQGPLLMNINLIGSLGIQYFGYRVELLFIFWEICRFFSFKFHYIYCFIALFFSGDGGWFTRGHSLTLLDHDALRLQAGLIHNSQPRTRTL